MNFKKCLFLNNQFLVLLTIPAASESSLGCQNTAHVYP